MSITEERRPAEKRTPSLHRLRRRTPSSCHATTHPAVSPSSCVDPVPQSSARPFDDKLVYAVHQAQRGASACSPEHVSRDLERSRGVVEDVSDEMLLRNVAEGDKAAMHTIFARHRKRVSQFIRRLVRNPAIVDDLVNQVFLDVWRSANMFEGRARVATWLLAIARFKAIGSQRERTHEDIDRDDVLGIIDGGETPDLALDRKETEGILRACIDKLPPAHREIIDLFYYHENSVAEVSGIIGIPQATVKSRIFYARKKLASILVGAGFDAMATL